MYLLGVVLALTPLVFNLAAGVDTTPHLDLGAGLFLLDPVFTGLSS